VDNSLKARVGFPLVLLVVAVLLVLGFLWNSRGLQGEIDDLKVRVERLESKLR